MIPQLGEMSPRRRRLLVLLLLLFAVYVIPIIYDLVVRPPLPYSPHNFVVATYVYGGLGDRFRTLLFGHYLAMITGRQFLFTPEFLNGPNYADVIPPNQWEGLSAGDIQYRGRGNEYFVETDQMTGMLGRKDIRSAEHAQVWVVETNLFHPEEMYHHPVLREYPGFAEFEKIYRTNQLWKRGLTALLKPSQNMEDLIQQVLQKELRMNPGAMPSHYYMVGIHIRHGDNQDMEKLDEEELRQMEVEERSSSRRPLEAKVKAAPTLTPVKPAEVLPFGGTRYHRREIHDNAIPCFWSHALLVAKEYQESEQQKGNKPREVAYFVTGDHQKSTMRIIDALRQAGYKAFNTDPYAGKIKHIDRAKGDHTRTFLDWFLLGRMDYLLISQSGFSEAIAKMSCAPLSVFVDVKGEPHFKNYEQQFCEAHFMRFPPEYHGLCNEHTDRLPVNEYLYILYP